MKMLSLFSGVGMIDLAASWAGIETVAFCEIEDYPQKVLKRRFPNVPIYSDVRELTAERLKADGISKIDQIKHQERNWPTPTANDYKGAGPTTKYINGKGKICDRTKMRLDYATQSNEGQLNADWVELLMGLPIGWTDIDIADEEIESWPGWPAAINVEQYAYEPARVVIGQKNRAKRLKSLGNGCVSQQIYLIFAAIREAEAEIPINLF